jgi:hypothetical protein
MDPRLNDPDFQIQLGKRLTSDNAIDMLEAQQLLQRNGVDVVLATAEAKKAKAVNWQVPQPARATTSIPSAPKITDAQATKLALALAGDNGSIAKLDATYFCQRQKIPFDEVRAHALRVTDEHARRGS